MTRMILLSGASVLLTVALAPVPATAQRHGGGGHRGAYRGGGHVNSGHNGGFRGGSNWRTPGRSAAGAGFRGPRYVHRGPVSRVGWRGAGYRVGYGYRRGGYGYGWRRDGYRRGGYGYGWGGGYALGLGIGYGLGAYGWGGGYYGPPCEIVYGPWGPVQRCYW